MQRTPEPELMTDADQVLAYAEADFEEPHQRFVDLLGERLPRLPQSGNALDIGCGPGDITCRFARAFPGFHVDGLDGSLPMLELARKAAASAGLTERARFHHCYLPEGDAPSERYDLVFSNSLLHHLADPAVLWRSVRRWSGPDGAVFVMDLARPDSTRQAARLVDQYSRDEPEVLRRDFYNSLLAAYRPDEVRQQLKQSDLAHLRLEMVSDRHWLVTSP
jgi:ubiquinone/menaquinone biosynthesis C-methylase UbiE